MTQPAAGAASQLQSHPQVPPPVRAVRLAVQYAQHYASNTSSQAERCDAIATGKNYIALADGAALTADHAWGPNVVPGQEVHGGAFARRVVEHAAAILEESSYVSMKAALGEAHRKVSWQSCQARTTIPSAASCDVATRVLST